MILKKGKERAHEKQDSCISSDTDHGGDFHPARVWCIRCREGGCGYQIAYKVKGTSKWKTKITTKNKVTLKKLKSNKQVQVKARAFVKVNGEKHYGAWSKAMKSKKIK